MSFLKFWNYKGNAEDKARRALEEAQERKRREDIRELIKSVEDAYDEGLPSRTRRGQHNATTKDVNEYMAKQKCNCPPSTLTGILQCQYGCSCTTIRRTCGMDCKCEGVCVANSFLEFPELDVRLGISGDEIYAEEDIEYGRLIIVFTGTMSDIISHQKELARSHASHDLYSVFGKWQGEDTLGVGKNGVPTFAINTLDKPAGFINHSCDPNMEVFEIWQNKKLYVVGRAIKYCFAGDVIAYDYKWKWDDNATYAELCLCETKDCRGFIAQVSPIVMQRSVEHYNEELTQLEAYTIQETKRIDNIFFALHNCHSFTESEIKDVQRLKEDVEELRVLKKKTIYMKRAIESAIEKLERLARLKTRSNVVTHVGSQPPRLQTSQAPRLPPSQAPRLLMSQAPRLLTLHENTEEQNLNAQNYNFMDTQSSKVKNQVPKETKLIMNNPKFIINSQATKPSSKHQHDRYTKDSNAEQQQQPEVKTRILEMMGDNRKQLTLKNEVDKNDETEASSQASTASKSNSCVSSSSMKFLRGESSRYLKQPGEQNANEEQRCMYKPTSRQTPKKGRSREVQDPHSEMEASSVASQATSVASSSSKKFLKGEASKYLKDPIEPSALESRLLEAFSMQGVPVSVKIPLRLKDNDEYVLMGEKEMNNLMIESKIASENAKQQQTCSFPQIRRPASSVNSFHPPTEASIVSTRSFHPPTEASVASTRSTHPPTEASGSTRSHQSKDSAYSLTKQYYSAIKQPRVNEVDEKLMNLDVSMDNVAGIKKALIVNEKKFVKDKRQDTSSSTTNVKDKSEIVEGTDPRKSRRKDTTSHTSHFKEKNESVEDWGDGMFSKDEISKVISWIGSRIHGEGESNENQQWPKAKEWALWVHKTFRHPTLLEVENHPKSWIGISTKTLRAWGKGRSPTSSSLPSKIDVKVLLSDILKLIPFRFSEKKLVESPKSGDIWRIALKNINEPLPGNPTLRTAG